MTVVMRTSADRETKSGMDFHGIFKVQFLCLDWNTASARSTPLARLLIPACRVAFKCAPTPGVTFGTSDSILPVLGAAGLLRAELQKGPVFNSSARRLRDDRPGVRPQSDKS